MAHADAAMTWVAVADAINRHADTHAAYEDNDESFFRLVQDHVDGQRVVLSFDGAEEWRVGVYPTAQDEQDGAYQDLYRCNAKTAVGVFTQEVTRVVA